MSDADFRRRVNYRGRVQGVGFRYTVATLARGLPVVGYVKNLADGSVELVVDADENVFKKLHTAIEDAFAGNIVDTIVEEIPTTEEFDGFSIRH